MAKLRRKVPKFALMAARAEPTAADVETDVVGETFEVLRKLGHGESDARRLLDTALAQKKKYKRRRPAASDLPAEPGISEV